MQYEITEKNTCKKLKHCHLVHLVLLNTSDSNSKS